MRGGARKFLTDSRGAVAPLFAVALIALAAAGGLAWDVSRGYANRSELEAAVDAAALAGATQLDGKSGAVDRAKLAAYGGLVKNSQFLATSRETDVIGADGGGKVTIVFLTDLVSRTATTNDAAAQFIQVDATPRALSLVFGALAGVNSNFRVTAHAIAGFGAALCKVPPLMVCNPAEPVGNTNANFPFNADSYVGYGLTLKGSPNSGAWVPGEFGYLSVGANANAIKDAMARNPPSTECFGDTVTTKPGNDASILDYFNVRFDIYTSGLPNTMQTDSAYAPAQNTVTGLDDTSSGPANKCKPKASGTKYDGNATGIVAMSLPRDTCAYPSPGTCQPGLGNGSWDRTGYFQVVHNLVYNAINTPTGEPWSTYTPVPSNGVQPSRYQVYKWELAHRGVTGLWRTTAMHADAGAGATGSSGTDFVSPQCSNKDIVSTPDRRTISVVVVNCRQQAVHGSMEVHVVSGVDVFLTEPAANTGPDMTIYGEILGVTSDLSTVGKETRLYSVRLYE
jgi:Flp pilus assembly protein TadG